jgi:5'-nucleotidase (lipoprotein e(P4) family)
MKSRIIIAAVALVVAGALTGCASRSPYAGAYLWWHYSGESRALYYQAFNAAQDFLDYEVKRVGPQVKVAVILDLDETVLDNGEAERLMFSHGKTYDAKAWANWVDQHRAMATAGAKAFLEHAAAMQSVEVFYISQRSEKQRQATLRNLEDLQFPMVDNRHVLLKTETKNKKEHRRDIAEERRPILFLGDDLNDLEDGLAPPRWEDERKAVDAHKDAFGRKFILLPNPMYGSWTSYLWKRDWREKRKADQAQKLLQSPYTLAPPPLPKD